LPPAACLVLPLAGCGGNQNTLDPASGPQRQIVRLWWVMLTGSAIAARGAPRSAPRW